MGAGSGGGRGFIDYQPVLLLGVLFLMIGFFQQRIYDWKLLLRPRKLLPLTLRAISFWFLVYLCTSVVLKFEPQISRIFMFYAWGSVAVLVVGWKWAFTSLLRSSGRNEQLAQRVVVLGWTEEAAELTDAIHGDDSHPYRVGGWIRTNAGGIGCQAAPSEFPELGSLPNLERLFLERRPDILVVADLDLNRDALAQIAKLCEVHYVQLKILPSMFQIFVSGLRLETISGRPLLGIEELPVQRLWAQLVKRVMDIVGALAGLIVAAPVMAVLAYLIRKEDPGPIFFRQERIGIEHEPFQMLKLRSMKIGSENSDHLNQSTLRVDPRVLSVGAFMRRWNLDELPQFWNVLRGQMSLVGPRPERTYHANKLSAEIQHYNYRHKVKPGITGWAQIHGLRGDTDLSERIQYDCYYIENWSVWMDLYCLVMTFFKRDNAY